MKKLILAFGIVSALFFGAETFAQSLPSSSTLNFQVTNISQNNQNALNVGARPGDVLRYELTLDSPTENVAGFVPTINVGDVLLAGDLIETELGVLNGSTIQYPSYSNDAPCTETFTFFVRIKEDCADKNRVTASAHGKTLNVNLNCSLSQSGADMTPFYTLIFALIAFFGIGFLFGATRKS